MRVDARAIMVLALAGQSLCLPLRAETVGKTVFPEPQASWFMMTASDASYIFDGADGQMKNVIGTLSGGQRQALTLLMASWQRPDLLLLDEHTAALDPKSADQVIRLTDEVVSQDRLTTLMVTHSMAQAANLGDRLIMMYHGRVIHDFSGAEKQRLRVEDLLARFEDVRRSEQLDESVAELLRRAYV